MTQTAPKPPTSTLAIVQSLPDKVLAHFDSAGYSEMRLVMTWQQIAPTLDLHEFVYFMERCVITGLDPLRRQIFAVKRKDRTSPSGYTVSHQVAIDGFRAQADATGLYAGSDPPEFSEPIEWKGKHVHEVCRVTVWKMVGGQRVGFTGECRLTEFYPGDSQGSMWIQYPHNQLAKCAEAQALRKAFPVQLGGVDVDGDMGSNDLESQFADALAARERQVLKLEDSPEPEPQYIEVTNTQTGEMTQVRAADEYQRLYPDEAEAAPAPAAAPPMHPRPGVTATAEPKISEQLARREAEGLCMHPECVEQQTPNRMAEGQRFCLIHVG